MVVVCSAEDELQAQCTLRKCSLKSIPRPTWNARQSLLGDIMFIPLRWKMTVKSSASLWDFTVGPTSKATFVWKSYGLCRAEVTIGSLTSSLLRQWCSWNTWPSHTRQEPKTGRSPLSSSSHWSALNISPAVTLNVVFEFRVLFVYFK